MALLNGFKLGADPEFVIYEGGHLLMARLGAQDKYAPFGFDHAGWVIEPHPKPDPSVRTLIGNLKKALNDFAASCTTAGKWRAGAYLQTPERPVTLGGHVHIDQPKPTAPQLASLDTLTKHLEALDIIPHTECEYRRNQGNGYGKYGDVRVEHGHFEYRTMPSWLYSQRATKLCLIGSKLVSVDPTSVEELGATRYASVPRLKAFFERFKGKDDDVDWLLASGMLDKKLVMKPDRDLKEVWSVTPEKEKPHWKEEAAKAGQLNVGAMPRENVGATNQAITPFVTQVMNWYVYRPVAPGFIPGPDEVRNMVAAFNNLAARPLIGRRLLVGGHDYSFIGQMNAPWQTETQTVRTQVEGVRYRWRLSHRQIFNYHVREILRAVVFEGIANEPGNLLLRDGLLFQPMGREGRVNEEDDWI